VFKVMTWNVENLFRAGQPSGPTSPSAYDSKLEGLAKAINEQAPDALALPEIGDPAALDDLVALLNGAWQQQVSTHPDGRGIRVAWLTHARSVTRPRSWRSRRICRRFRSTTTAPRRRRWPAARWRSAWKATPAGPSG
jgi:hypothetical protein